MSVSFRLTPFQNLHINPHQLCPRRRIALAQTSTHTLFARSLGYLGSSCPASPQHTSQLHDRSESSSQDAWTPQSSVIHHFLAMRLTTWGPKSLASLQAHTSVLLDTFSLERRKVRMMTTEHVPALRRILTLKAFLWQRWQSHYPHGCIMFSIS